MQGRLITLAIALAWLPLATPCQGAVQAAAVIDDGYAGRVLQKILPGLPPLASQRSEARLSLDGEGRYQRCTSLHGEGQSICTAAKSIGAFGTPPYAVPTDILLSVSNGKTDTAHTAKASATSPTPAKNYAHYLSRVKYALRNAMYIPQETKPGTYHATVRLKCDAKGKILERNIVKASGDARLDRYVLQGIDRAGTIEAPPAGMQHQMDIDFTLVR